MVKPKHKQKSAVDLMKRFASILTIATILLAIVPLNTLAVDSKAVDNMNPTAGLDIAKKHTGLWYKTHILPAQRKAAVANFKETYAANRYKTPRIPAESGAAAANFKAGYGNVMNPGVPHYFGPYPNYAYTPLPNGPIKEITVDTPGTGYQAANVNVNITDVYGAGTGATATANLNPDGNVTNIDVNTHGNNYTAPVVTITGLQGTGATATAILDDTALSGGVHKFVDSLPGLNAAGANDNGQYIPVAKPNTTAYPGSDYYVIEQCRYTEKLHSDLPTTLQGYRQVSTPTIQL